MSLFRPSMSTANCHHRAEDIVPCLPLHERFVGEHASVPADVIEPPAGLSVIIAQPIPGVLYNVDLAVGRVRQAVSPCLVMRSRTEDFAIVLGHMEINRPGSQGGSEPFIAGVECCSVVPIEIGGNEPILGCVVAKHEEQRMCHISLEAQSL